MEVFGRLSVGDRARTIDILNERLSPTDLRNLADALDKPKKRGKARKTVEQLVLEAGREQGVRGRPPTKLPVEDLAAYIVDRHGISLLEEAEVRRCLVGKASGAQRDLLNSYAGADKVRGRSSEIVRGIAARKWHAGKSWARYFVRILELPAALAGLPGSSQEPAELEVEPFVPLNDLADFQLDLKGQAVEVLDAGPGENRAVLTLPTGAGKTRTAVESLVSWLLGQSGDPVLLWIAQSEELCEQAVQAFRDVWIDLGHRFNVRSSLKIARFWGSTDVPEMPVNVVVASIQKVHAVVRNLDSEERAELVELARQIGAVVVDEAHRIGAPSYKEVLRFLNIDVSKDGRSEVPLLGLTATPYRKDDQETEGMSRMFHGRLLSAASLGQYPIKELRSRGVLSSVEHEFLSSGEWFDMERDKKFREHYDQFHDFHTGFLQEISESKARNKELYNRLMEIPETWPTLFFGCTVEHAEAMSILLRRAGRSAEVITGETRAATRRALIEEFREGNISVLCNFGVLTTGFDAPKVRALVVGRPTSSRVLYAQMIGRGMRGKAFGGTESCLVVDVQDNIRFQGELAYNKYAEFYR